jgi:ketosteroid isomerase-like protein
MAVKDAAGEVVTKAKRRFGVENPSAADADGNVGTVRGALRAFGNGEFDAFLDALQEDVRWEAPEGGDFPGGGDLEGREAIKDKFIGDTGRTFTQFGFVPENFVDTDDEAVIVVGRFTGEGTDGAALDTPGVQIWQFGRSTEAELIRIYTDSAAFPELITEQKLREQEEEEKRKKQEEEEKKQKAEAEEKDDSDDDESDSDSDEQPKAKADSDSDDSDDDSDSGSKKDGDEES